MKSQVILTQKEYKDLTKRVDNGKYYEKAFCDISEQFRQYQFQKWLHEPDVVITTAWIKKELFIRMLSRPAVFNPIWNDRDWYWNYEPRNYNPHSLREFGTIKTSEYCLDIIEYKNRHPFMTHELVKYYKKIDIKYN